MTVKELIEILRTIDGDRIVILQKDSGGNGHSPLRGADDNAVYDAMSTYSGEVKFQTLTPHLLKQGYSEEDTGDGTPCVVLYPVN